METTIKLTENSYIYQSAKRLLNRELAKCTALLKETEEKWNEFLDLKLHDAFTENIDFECYGAKVSFDDEEQNRYFYQFCDDTYECFMEWCKENGIDFDKLRDNIGRTSSFYLGKLHNDTKEKYLAAMCDNVSDIYQSTYTWFKEVDGIIVYDEEETFNSAKESISGTDLEQIISEMLSTAETIYDELQHALEDIIKVYDYIHDVKENQSEYFKDYVRDNWLANAS